ncbi:hypothetical protein WDU94_007633 [Cyamophila willieti]
MGRHRSALLRIGILLTVAVFGTVSAITTTKQSDSSSDTKDAAPQASVDKEEVLPTPEELRLNRNFSDFVQSWNNLMIHLQTPPPGEIHLQSGRGQLLAVSDSSEVDSESIAQDKQGLYIFEKI